MRTVVTAGVLALSGLLTIGVGVANADEIQVEGNYSSEAGCQADGPHVEITQNNGAYTHFSCHQHDDGLWYLYLSN